MSSRDEQYFPKEGDKQEEQFAQSQPRASRRPSDGQFSSNRQRVDKQDLRSVEQVWERLEEHVTRNSATYQTNRNVRPLRAHDPGTGKDQPMQVLQKRGILSRSLSMAAIVCVLIVVVGSLVVVLYSARQSSSSSAAPNQEQMTGTPSKEPPIKGGEISIVEGKGGVEIKPSELKIQVGMAVRWNNETNASQVLISESKGSQDIKLAPQASTKVSFATAGTYTWHVLSNPNVHVFIYVFGVPATSGSTIIILPSNTGNEAIFVPSALKLKVGSNVMWTNATGQTQVVVSDSNYGNVTLAPKASTSMTFDTAGTYNWHLASNPIAHAVIVFIS